MATKNKIMGILDFFKKGVLDVELCKLRDLISVAYAGGEMTDKERKVILEIVKKDKINSGKFHQVITMNPDRIKDCYPIEKEKRDKYLFELVYLMTIERKKSKSAMAYVELVARKLGYTSKDIYELMEVISSSPFSKEENKKTHQWSFKSSRAFNETEIEQVERAEVVSSQYGNSVCFFMKTGGNVNIPLTQDSALSVGDSVDVSKAKLITLEKPGECDIVRVKV